MIYDETDIPIECAECPGHVEVEGIEAMEDHILEMHQNYTHTEAAYYANLWADVAFEQLGIERY